MPEKAEKAEKVKLASKCDYCGHSFQKSEKIWFNPKIGTICEQKPGKECGAVHIGKWRTNSWTDEIFSK